MTQVPSKLDDLLVRLDVDLLYQFSERAGIMEYDGGAERDEAELLAMIDLLRIHPGALLGLRFLRLEATDEDTAEQYLLTTDVDAAWERAGHGTRMHDVDDPAAVLRERFDGVAALATWLRPASTAHQPEKE